MDWILIHCAAVFSPLHLYWMRRSALVWPRCHCLQCRLSCALVYCLGGWIARTVLRRGRAGYPISFLRLGICLYCCFTCVSPTICLIRLLSELASVQGSDSVCRRSLSSHSKVRSVSWFAHNPFVCPIRGANNLSEKQTQSLSLSLFFFLTLHRFILQSHLFSVYETVSASLVMIGVICPEILTLLRCLWRLHFVDPCR